MRRHGLVMAAALAASTAQAADGANTRRFAPSPLLSPYLTLDGARTHGDGGLAFSVMGTYERRPLIFYKDGRRTADIVSARSAADVALAWGATDWLDLGAGLPLVLDQEGREVDGGPLERTAFGDVALGARARLLDPDASGLGVALVGLATLPTGDAGALAAEPAATATARLALEAPLGTRFEVAMNAGARFRAPARVDQIGLEHELLFGLGASFRATARVAFVAEATVGTPLSAPFGETEATPADANGGLRVHLWEGLQLVAGGGAGLRPGYGSPEWRAIVGFEAMPRRRDFDGDRVADGGDACVDVAGVPAREGCPEPTLVAVAPTPPDADADGLPDAGDNCPRLPEDRDGFRDDDGCPDPDQDLDLIADGEDGDPHGAEDWDAYRDEDGVPDLDNDEDGIADFRDACPLDAAATADGCPGGAENVATTAPEGPDAPLRLGDTLHPAGPVVFEYAKAALSPEGTRAVAGLAAYLLAHPELGRLEVGVHTDAGGNRPWKAKMTQVRARALLEALVAHGVPRERLTARGYGAAVPVARNDTEAGRLRNRRVELRLLEGAAPSDPVAPPAPRRRTPAAGLIPLPGPLSFVPLKAELAPEAHGTLAMLAETLTARRDRVEIGVHTDGGGDVAWKTALTTARAAAVRDALVALGVPASRLVARGHGATRPVASDATRAGRAKNRRVELRSLDEPDDAPGPTAERRP